MGWPTTVLAVYEWDDSGNRGKNALGNSSYDLTARGSQTYSTSNIKAKTKWTNGGSNANGFSWPSALKTLVAGKTAWQIESWWQCPNPKSNGVYDGDMIFSMDNTTSSSNALIGYGPSDSAASPWKNRFWVEGSSVLNNQSFNASTAAGTWYYIIIQWDGTAIKFYLGDGTTQNLVKTINTTSNIFNTIAGTVRIGDALQNNVAGLAMFGYLDRYIIRDTVTNGVPTVYVSDPTITNISPNTGSTAGGTAVTITGTEFATGATVTFGGVSATDIVVVSATEITCVTPAGTAGAVDVVITNTDTGTVTSAGGFTYVVPITGDVHYTGKVIPQEFTILLTDSDITNYQTEPYEREEQLNVIDTFDFAFDTVSASAPIEFFKFLNTRANNTLKVKDKAGIVIYAGNVSGVKSNTELDFASKIMNIESSPLIESVSTSFAAYDIAATSPVKVIKQLLDAAVSLPYSVAKLYGLASLLPGINISVDTDGEDDNTKSIIQSICEYFNIGVYLDALTVRAHVAQVLPDDATDILPYLINSQPTFTSRGDLYADKIMLTYSTAVGAAEASVTSGSGDTVKEIQISAPIFMDAASAQATADRALEIYSQKIYEAEIQSDKTAMFKLGDTIKYTSVLGDFICLIIGKVTTRSQITYKVLGVLK